MRKKEVDLFDWKVTKAFYVVYSLYYLNEMLQCQMQSHDTNYVGPQMTFRSWLLILPTQLNSVGSALEAK